MKLDKFKEEIYKCSGCGLCQSVCPVYKVLKTECAVSRGKFKLLNAILNKDIGFSKKTLEIMDLCLHCQACSEFCPSGIDAQKIIETAQYDMLNCKIYNNKKFVLAKVFQSKFLLLLLKLGINVVRELKIFDFLVVLGFKKFELYRDFLKRRIRPLRKKSNTKKEIKAVFFKGCINNYINSSSANAVYKIFDKTNVEILDCDFSCCGLPMKSAGNEEKFIELAKANIDKLPDDFDYLVFDCQSCKSTFLAYASALQDDYKIKALNIADKCISVYGLLEKINYLPKKQWKHSVVTVHYPCHTRFSNDKVIIEKLVKKIPNITFVEAKNANECCGAAGSFFLTNKDLSKQISHEKAKGIIDTEAEVVVTACPACALGIKQGLQIEQASVKVMQLIELLAQ